MVPAPTVRTSLMARSMALLPTAIAMALVASTGHAVHAQQQPPASTIQLPTFNVFSYNGTVLVPDQGSTYAGGSHYAVDSLVSGGPFPVQRARSLLRSQNGLQVTATIIDLQAMDRQLLAQTAPSPRAMLSPVDSSKPRADLAPMDDPIAYGKWLVRRARGAAKRGEPGAARVLYQMAIKRLPENLASIASSELAALPEKKPSKDGQQPLFRFVIRKP
jgi:hypothetical protein